MYVAIDGDDSGRKITACYIHNDELKLRQISEDLKQVMIRIGEMLLSEGYIIIFCAADGIAAKSSADQLEFEQLFSAIRNLASPVTTFSVGVGKDLREAYIALLEAKCTGKDRVCLFAELDK